MSRYRNMFKVCIGLLWLWMSTLVRTDLVIEITQGVRQCHSIAVVPFRNQVGANLPEDVAQIISENLQRTGDLNPLTRENMLSLPTRGEDVFSVTGTSSVSVTC